MKKLLRLALLLVTLVASTGVALADSALPEPESPQTARLEDGKIVVDIGTPRNAGYAIGDSIPVIIVFERKHNKDAEAKATGVVPAQKPFDPSSFLTDSPKAPTAPAAAPLPVPRVNISALQMNVLSAQPSDVEILVVPGDPQEYTDGDTDYTRVVFWVWEFVNTQKDSDGKLKKQVAITADFLYAIDTLPDGQPDWKKATTPEIQVGIVPIAGDNMVTMREGDLSAKVSTHAAVIPYLFWFGIACMMPLFAALGWLAYCHYMRPRRLSANEIFWVEIDRVVEEATETGSYALEDYQKIIYELRRRYGVSTLHTGDALTALEAEPHYKAIERVFILEETFFRRDGIVTPEQHEELMSSLKLLIPRT